MMNECEKALKMLEAEYHKQCKEAGHPCDYVVNEPLSSIISDLREMLGQDPSYVDPTALVSFAAFEDYMTRAGKGKS